MIRFQFFIQWIDSWLNPGEKLPGFFYLTYLRIVFKIEVYMWPCTNLLNPLTNAVGISFGNVNFLS